MDLLQPCLTCAGPAWIYSSNKWALTGAWLACELRSQITAVHASMLYAPAQP